MAICALLLGSLVAGSAEAQRRGAPRFRIHGWSGKVSLGLRYDDDTRQTSGQPTATEREWLLEQEVVVGAKGWVYHPALMGFSGQLGLLLDQDFASSDPGGRSAQLYRGRLNFNANANILPYKPYPITLFASQAHSEVNSPLAQRRTVDTLRYGGGLALRELSIGEWDFPTRLLYRHQDTETSGRFGSTRARDELELVIDNQTDRVRNRLQYEWESLSSESGGTSREFVRQDLRFLQDVELDRGRLSSRVLMTDSGGDRRTRFASLNESLSLRHRRSFRSNYGYGLNFQSSDGSRLFSHRAQLGVSHQLYESLATSASAGGSYSDAELGRIWEANGSLGINYTKRIPGGRFRLRFSPTLAYQDESLDSGVVTTTEQLTVVLDASGTSLEQPFVLPATIEVTDPDDPSIVFVEGTDYEIDERGDFAFVIILPGGQLDDLLFPGAPDEIAVRYDYRTRPARAFSTWTTTSGFSLDLWEHLSLDVSYSSTTHQLRRGSEDDSTLDDPKRFNALCQLVFENNRTRLEYERIRSGITPRERFRATHSATFRPGRRVWIGLGASYSHDRITDTGRLSNAYGLNASGTAALPYGILARLNLLARYVDQEEQRTTTAGGGLVLTYQYGRLQFQLQERLDWIRSIGKTGRETRIRELSNSVMFKVVRPF